MTANSSLIKLLQLCDSAFPLGAYSHSWGLETWVQREQLLNRSEVESAISTLLRLSIAPKEGTAVRLAHQYAAEADANSFHLLNQTLTATNWAPEIENASLAMGQRLRLLAHNLGWIGNVAQSSVHHCAMFGWLSAILSIDLASAVTAYLSTAVSAHTSACVKLVPLGHTDGQRIIANLSHLVESEAQTICLAESPCIKSFAPMHEWASFEHERLYSRLFQS